MNKVSTVSNLLDSLSKQEQKELVPIQQKYYNKKAKALLDNCGFNIGDILFFSCSGSGYIGRFNKVTSDTLILNICNKHGKENGKIFRCSYFDLDRLSLLTSAENI